MLPASDWLQCPCRASGLGGRAGRQARSEGPGSAAELARELEALRESEGQLAVQLAAMHKARQVAEQAAATAAAQV